MKGNLNRIAVQHQYHTQGLTAKQREGLYANNEHLKNFKRREDPVPQSEFDFESPQVGLTHGVDAAYFTLDPVRVTEVITQSFDIAPNASTEYIANVDSTSHFLKRVCSAIAAEFLAMAQQLINTSTDSRILSDVRYKQLMQASFSMPDRRCKLWRTFGEFKSQHGQVKPAYLSSLLEILFYKANHYIEAANGGRLSVA